jgi:cytochrome oxidase Cu insertion factor (SCO1/SenC/PrrC family)
MNEVDKPEEKSTGEGAPAVNNPIANSKRNPYTVWFVVIAFIAPVVLAYIMFFFVDVKSFVNHGEILNPIVHIASFKLKDENNDLVPEGDLTYKWRLISFVGKDCDEQCETRLYDTRQIHTLLAKDQHRLMRMFVHLEPAGDSLIKLIEQTHPNVIHVNGDADTIIDALGANVREGAGIMNNETYIMDPMGNVMMRFTQDQPNKEFFV